jgi:tRNA A37 threonylcarbamoyltransferase TsaD
MELCTDNAAMVAACATYMIRRGRTTSLDAAPDPNLPLVGG